jgi:hypothetical protein
MDPKSAFVKLLGLVRELAQVRHAGEAAAIVEKLDQLEAEIGEVFADESPAPKK